MIADTGNRSPWAIARGLTIPAKLMLGATGLSRFAAYMIWPFIAVVMNRRFETPLVEIGTQLSLGAFIAIIMAPISGMLADRVSRKGLMLGACALAIASFMLMGLVGNELSFLAGILLSAFAGGCLEPLLRATLGDCAVCDDERPVLFHIRYYLINFSVASGPLCGAWFADRDSSAVFFLAGGTYAFLAVSILFIGQNRPKDLENHDRLRIGQVLKSVLRSPVFGALFMSNFLLVFLYAQTDEPLTFYLIALQVDAINAVIAAINMTNIFVVLAVHLFMMKWLISLEEQKAYALACVFLTVGLATISLNMSGNTAIWLVAIGFATLAEIIIMPLLATIVDRRAPANMRNSYVGIYMLSTVSAALVPFLGAIAIEQIGGSTLFAIAAMACLPIGLLGFRILQAVTDKAAQPKGMIT